MKFDDAVRETRTLTDLRRIAGAHVVDHRQLADEELRDSIIKVKPQYLHEETVRLNLERRRLILSKGFCRGRCDLGGIRSPSAYARL